MKTKRCNGMTIRYINSGSDRGFYIKNDKGQKLNCSPKATKYRDYVKAFNDDDFLFFQMRLDDKKQIHKKAREKSSKEVGELFEILARHLGYSNYKK